MLSSLTTTPETTPEQCEAMAWGSHLPALLAVIRDTGGPVLELGIGHFSTPHLHVLCGATGRNLWSVEDNREWFDPFAAKYESPEHRFISLPYPEAIAEASTRSWSVVFIDHSPGGENRAFAFKTFANISRFMVVHDYHLENEEAIKPLLEGMKYHVTRTYQPPTLIASKTREIPRSVLCL